MMYIQCQALLVNKNETNDCFQYSPQESVDAKHQRTHLSGEWRGNLEPTEM